MEQERAMTWRRRHEEQYDWGWRETYVHNLLRHYTFLKDAYIHGLMDGEAVNQKARYGWADHILVTPRCVLGRRQTNPSFAVVQFNHTHECSELKDQTSYFCITTCITYHPNITTQVFIHIERRRKPISHLNKLERHPNQRHRGHVQSPQRPNAIHNPATQQPVQCSSS
jgi:hypothetical protein